ncbi:hypothetical protein ACU4GD_07570 [Cupriavidus basilensis]
MAPPIAGLLAEEAATAAVVVEHVLDALEQQRAPPATPAAVVATLPSALPRPPLKKPERAGSAREPVGPERRHLHGGGLLWGVCVGAGAGLPAWLPRLLAESMNDALRPACAALQLVLQRGGICACAEAASAWSSSAGALHEQIGRVRLAGRGVEDAGFGFC